MSVPYVNERVAAMIAEIENRFRSLPPNAGVLFVSVGAVPVEGGNSPELWVRLGLTKNLSRDVGELIVQKVLENELASNLKVRTVVYLGVPGAAHDSSDARTDSSPA